MKRTLLILSLLIISISAYANITFSDFDCDKVCYKPGEEVKCYADIKSDKSLDATITWYVYKGFTKTEYKKEISIIGFLYYKTPAFSI